VRVLAATNADPKRAVQNGALREDLYYRLNVVQISAPPLRDRREDIPLLVEHFLRKYNQQFHKRIAGVSSAALEVLQAYSWPGNVRELSNIVERSVALVDGSTIDVKDLPLDLLLPDPRARPESAEELPLKEAREQFERQLILQTLERAQWNRTQAARLLGMHRNSLKAKLEAWGIRGLGSDS
jgi:two-component system response regulator AtoC